MSSIAIEILKFFIAFGFILTLSENVIVII